jgi:hypothetical protein
MRAGNVASFADIGGEVIEPEANLQLNDAAGKSVAARLLARV